MRLPGHPARDIVGDGIIVANDEVGRYIEAFSERHSIADVERALDDIRGLRVLVVGETIIDEYVYCETMGKTGKEPILAARFAWQEKFAGGVLAIANHLAAVTDYVKVLSFVGEIDSYEDFIRGQVNPKVDLELLRMRSAPTIVKRRFLESYPLQKLFEIYVMDGRPADHPTQAAALNEALGRLAGEYDVVVVADYGHGMMDEQAIETVCSRAHFLAINTQTNADNRGFNTVSKYPRADFVTASETEIRLEARSRERDVRDIIKEVSAGGTRAPRLMVTRGSRGSLYYDHDSGFYEVPAFTTHHVDRVGAGDALLSVTSLCAARGVHPELIAAIGNAVGAQAVASVGNSAAIDPKLLVEEFATLFSL